MTDRPIIFSAFMIRALIEGRKTMTRRLAWSPFDPGPMTIEPDNVVVSFERKLPAGARTRHAGPGEYDFVVDRPTIWQQVKPGDRLWVREAFTTYTSDDGKRTPIPMYAADFAGFNKPERDWDWTSPIHMPRELSRLTLAVTATKIERLCDISAEDAVAEGIAWDGEPLTGNARGIAVALFMDLWTRLHGEDSVFLNPEVVALTLMPALKIRAPDVQLAEQAG